MSPRLDIDESIDLILREVPEFAPLHTEFLGLWASWPGEIPGYAAITCFGQEFLAEMLKREATGEEVVKDVVDTSLGVVEVLLEKGDALVVDAVYFGIIEYIFGMKDQLSLHRLGPLTAREIDIAGS